MLNKLIKIAPFIGGTPLKRLTFDKVDLYVKLEYFNYSGSIKDRPAYKIILEGIKNGEIDENTTVVESSSGNFAISLASICRELGLKFIPVIDPNINKDSRELLNLLSYKVEKVEDRDETGGFLLTRIKRVKEICEEVKNSFWTNQYENPNNYRAYYDSLGNEICNSFNDLNYLFIGVSSGGTLAGVSQRVKEKFPNIKIIAVDVEGSVIFNNEYKKRHITGIGASKIPPIIKNAIFDEVMLLPQLEIINGCYELLSEQTIFGGASAGAMYAALKKFFSTNKSSAWEKALFVCPDKGSSYLDTVYNSNWVNFVSSENK